MHAIIRRRRPAGLAAGACLLAAWAALAIGPPATGAVPAQQSPLQDARQLLVVTTDGWAAVDGTLRRFDRMEPSAAWKPTGAPVAVVVGRGGTAWGRGLHPAQVGGPVKQEGDGKSPAGVFRLGRAFGFSPGKPADWRVSYLFLDHDVECVDDAQSRYYNRLVARARVERPDWASSEKMWDEPLYEWGLVVEHNSSPARPAAGSCIFLHIWNGPGRGTAGCTAMALSDLLDVLGWLDPARQPLLVQLPKDTYARLAAAWHLPQ